MVHFSLHFAVERLQIPAECWLWSPQKFEYANGLWHAKVSLVIGGLRREVFR